MDSSKEFGDIPSIAKDSVFLHSEPIEDDDSKVLGPSKDKFTDITIKEYCKGIKNMGFQATNIGRAIDEIKKMLSWRLSDEEIESDEVEPYNNLEYRRNVKCAIWLSFTSNMISSGLREIFVHLAKNKLIDVIVTSAGGVEEDFIKVLGNTFLGEFTLKGSELRKKGWNRIGNLLVPNQNYVDFEEWLQPLLDEMLEMQNKDSVNWTPSKMIHFLGEKINHEESLYYWCYKNNIPVFCPGITDGSLGDNLFFHSYRNPGLKIDVVEDIRKINDIALNVKKSGIIILGGGVPKHHICNANLMRNGADYAVYISSATEFDGSDSGASPDEAVSWGKIKAESTPVKVFGDATIIFPLIFYSTFLDT
ncbi:deoxyhypusine synthase [Cryptosporidium sp. chipmunk genotype I]|uniref:deoxyhypusine synthase n=1 Tax=Cryptosporidium sp. chipmunk genotype I TaxID=1280935 RepID=UPI00351A69A3|nr:deoxyhypusine synthase [Cryptosporidium sp. chipmunk genotype I]